jgi:uncharacterized membrane protein YqjE
VNGVTEPDRSIGAVLSDIVGDLHVIVRGEMRLAKAEIREEIAKFKRGAVLLLAGSLVLMAALGCLLLAAIYGLATVWPPWAAALAVGGGAALFGAALALGGSKQVRAVELAAAEDGSFRQGEPPVGEITHEIEREIRDSREDLGRNLNELEDKARELADWRSHYRNHSGAFLGAAFAAGAIAAMATIPASSGRPSVHALVDDDVSHDPYPNPTRHARPATRNATFAASRVRSTKPGD